ncbi:MAG TPA: hypothetical protein DIW54_01860 [Chitinophagaceae bacterium]|nr:hypothetical protein [Chitinophagaceae bacterium]
MLKSFSKTRAIFSILAVRAKRITRYSCLFLLLLPTHSCRDSNDPAEPTLTDNQWEALKWTDWGAGFATAGMGVVSFGIAAGASLAYYYDKLPEKSNIPNGTSEFIYNSKFPNEQIGVDHNNLCVKYLEKGYDELDYYKLFELAKEVRPDLKNEFDKLDISAAKKIVEDILDANFNTSVGRMEFVKKYSDLSGANLSSLSKQLDNLYYSSNNDILGQKVDSFINEIKSCGLPSKTEDKFRRSLPILKYSAQLWKR